MDKITYPETAHTAHTGPRGGGRGAFVRRTAESPTDGIRGGGIRRLS
jgi:hypothetical protein